eukprot:CAMPEP_0179416702 /NCGR_PEP_ID=MMETSP0799-20121207/6944_1 /TAXON_ID=46947 /ORGANISM="Geminigera cryophila, Strain CCMP2564" /LENGTH=43 /DNA_ID= /DNA_START= /DNA_END= /DNA_ORIENTATION=
MTYICGNKAAEEFKSFSASLSLAHCEELEEEVDECPLPADTPA